MNGKGEALILVTLVIEMFTTEGNTRSVMSAIDSGPPWLSTGFGTTVTGVELARVSAAISGWGEPPVLAQPAAATPAIVASASKGGVNRRVVIDGIPQCERLIGTACSPNRGGRQFIPGPARASQLKNSRIFSA